MSSLTISISAQVQYLLRNSAARVSRDGVSDPAHVHIHTTIRSDRDPISAQSHWPRPPMIIKWAFVYPPSPRRPRHKHAPFPNIDHTERRISPGPSLHKKIRDLGSGSVLDRVDCANTSTERSPPQKKGALPLRKEDFSKLNCK